MYYRHNTYYWSKSRLVKVAEGYAKQDSGESVIHC